MEQAVEIPLEIALEPDESNVSHWPLTLTAVGTSLLSFFLPILLVRTLSPAEVGAYKQFFLFVTVAPGVLLTAGFLSLIPFWSNLRGGATLQAGLRTVQLLALFGSCAIVALLYFLGDLPLRTDTGILLLCSALALGSIYMFPEEVALTRRSVTKAATVSAIFEVLRVTAMLIGIYLTKSLEVLLLAHCTVATLRWAYFVLCTDWVHIPQAKRITTTEYKKVLWKSLPLSFAWCCGALGDRFDQIILSSMLNPENFALYSVGCLMIPPLYALEQSVMRVTIAELSKSVAANNLARSRDLLRNSMGELLLFLAPVSMALIIYAKPLTVIIFTATYAAASIYLALFALSYLLLAVPFDAVARARGDSKWIVRSLTVAAATSLVSTLIGISIAGAIGALASFLLARAAVRFWGLRYAAKHLECSVQELFPLPILHTTLSRLCLLALPILAVHQLFSSDIVWCLSTLPFAVFGYLFLARGELVSIIPNLQNLPQQSDIIHVSQHITVGGLERFVTALALASKKQAGANVAVVAYDHQQKNNEDDKQTILQNRLTAAGIKSFVATKKPGISFATCFTLARIITLNPLAVFHTHNIGPLLYMYLAAMIARRKPVIIHTQHTLMHRGQTKRWQSLEKRLFAFAARVISVSDNVHEAISNSKANFEIIQNGVGTQDSTPAIGRESFANTYGLNPDKKWIVSLARISPEKNQLAVVQLWSELPEATRHMFQCVFAGPISDVEYGAAVSQEIQKTSGCVLLGECDEPETLLSMSEGFVSLSKHEGLPLAVLEAGSQHVPLFLSQIDGHALFLGHATFSNTSQSLQNWLEMITCQDAEICSLSKKTAELVKQQYHFDATYTKYAYLYRNLAKKID